MTLYAPPLNPTTLLAAGQEASGHVEPTPLLTIEQAAERLGTPTRFVRRLIAQRRIRFCRIGRYVRIAANDLADFIEAGRVEPAAPGRGRTGPASAPVAQSNDAGPITGTIQMDQGGKPDRPWL